MALMLNRYTTTFNCECIAWLKKVLYNLSLTYLSPLLALPFPKHPTVKPYSQFDIPIIYHFSK